MIATAAVACLAGGCATPSGGGPVAASSATVMVATATGAATASVRTVTLTPVANSPSPTGLATAGAVIPTGPVTQADTGETFLLTVGQQITVVLTAAPMMWDQPAAQGSALTRVSASGGYPGTTPAIAVFRAVAPGTAQVTSATDMQCLHAKPPCSVPQEIWTAWVVVV